MFSRDVYSTIVRRLTDRYQAHFAIAAPDAAPFINKNAQKSVRLYNALNFGGNTFSYEQLLNCIKPNPSIKMFISEADCVNAFKACIEDELHHRKKPETEAAADMVLEILQSINPSKLTPLENQQIKMGNTSLQFGDDKMGEFIVVRWTPLLPTLPYSEEYIELIKTRKCYIARFCADHTMQQFTSKGFSKLLAKIILRCFF